MQIQEGNPRGKPTETLFFSPWKHRASHGKGASHSLCTQVGLRPQNTSAMPPPDRNSMEKKAFPLANFVSN